MVKKLKEEFKVNDMVHLDKEWSRLVLLNKTSDLYLYVLTKKWVL